MVFLLGFHRNVTREMQAVHAKFLLYVTKLLLPVCNI